MKSPLGAYRDAIFFASGFAGLIYESIWTHYLKLFLGHAAYAQTLVLAIFMGGMAIGAAVVARSTDRIESPLRVYAIVEAAIGVLAFAFHPLFVLTTQGFYNVAFDTQWSGAFFTAAKWALAAMLILPQSILLGATFPLFSSAAARDAPADQGHSIATLYFANSAGGALGVLAAGFLLVPEVGLFGTIASAGVLNLAIAAIVIASWNAKASRAVDPVEPPKPAASKRKRQREASQTVSRRGSASDRIAGFSNARGREAAKAAAQSDPVPLASDKLVLRLVSAVCLLTGASSFIYEIGWIRMLSLVLGSATHSFELMLSSFVLGLALGGFWIRTRIDGVVNRGLRLGYVQIAMGCAALATVPLYSMSFNIVAAALSVLPRTDGGYTLFNVMRYGVASLIMFPAAFCAGMTLPLATRILYSMKEKGERAIGYVYSVNTVGAIVGLAFAVHVGMPLLGLEYLVGFGGVIDVLLGAALFVVFGSRRNRTFAYAAVLGSTVAMFAVAQTVDPQKLASSVFRIGRASTPGTVLEVAHGKTATITVERRQLGRQDLISIKTNGKPDAAANMNPRANFVPDQLTTALLGAVPLLIHDAPREIANIGFGSGLTGAVLLTDPRVLHLDTIEIEPRMVDLARHFDPLNRNVYTDPRSAIRIEDAKSFFAANGKRYDVIVSEPSNPWVSGVSGLFSVDFYRHVARYLNDDGLFAQWLQAYETHPDRIVSVLKAMDEAFDDYAVVALNEIDVLLIGKRHGKLTLPADAYPGLSAATREALRAVDVVNQADITLRIAGNKALFRPWLDSRPIAANSDFMPYLDSYSDRDRFFNRAWREFVDVALSPVPVAEILGGRPPLPTPSALTISPQLGPEPQWVAARMAWEALFGPMRSANAFAVPINMPANMADEAKAILDGCANASVADSASAIARVATRILPYLSPAEGRDILGSLQNAACFTNLTGAQAQWPLLLHAVVERDAQNFGRIADALLSAGQGATSAGMRYLLGMAMLGHIRAGNRQRASELWTQFARRALGDQPPGLPLYLLYAHAVAGGRQ